MKYYAIVLLFFLLPFATCQWNNAAQEVADLSLKCIRNFRAASNSTYKNVVPPIARALYISASCVYDTWAAIDGKALPTIITNGIDKYKGPKQTADIAKAIHFAGYRALINIFPDQSVLLNGFMAGKGYNVNDLNTDWEHNPVGLANVACAAIIADKHFDGANQYGDEIGSDGTLYGDYTNYDTLNPPWTQIGRANCAAVVNINHWQPPRFRTATGSAVQSWRQEAQFANCKTFSLAHTAEFRVQGPYRNQSNSQAEFLQNFRDVMDASGQLGDYERVISNHWQVFDGSTSAGQWLVFALNATQIKNLNLEESIKLIFMVSAAVHDVGVASHESKRFYDINRPTQVIQCAFKGETINAWRGPYQGVGPMLADNWTAYYPDTQVQNGGPEYPCGHCSQSSAAAEVLKLFFEDDTFIGSDIIYAAGSVPLERKITVGNPGYIAGVTDVPNQGPGTVGYVPAQPVTLHYNTWSDMAAEAAESRVLVGIHTPLARDVAVPFGRRVGRRVFDTFRRLVNGKPITTTYRAICEKITNDNAGNAQAIEDACKAQPVKKYCELVNDLCVAKD